MARAVLVFEVACHRQKASGGRAVGKRQAAAGEQVLIVFKLIWPGDSEFWARAEKKKIIIKLP